VVTVRAQRGGIAALLLLATPACVATVRVSPAQYVPKNLPAKVLILDDAGLMYVMERPTIVGEHLTGFVPGTPATFSVAVSRVREATVTAKSPVRTALLVGTLTSLAGAVVLVGTRGGKAEPCKLIWDHEDIPGKGTDCDPSAP